MGERLRKIMTGVLLIVFLISTALTVNHRIDAAAGEKSGELALQIAAQTKETEIPEEPAALAEKPESEQRKPQQISKTVWVPVPVKSDGHMQQLAEINLDALREVNPDVVGWIMIPDTKINYPIVHGEDNWHYLWHTWDNRENAGGSIFVEETGNPDFTEFRTIVYGHNLSNGAMFGSLSNYRSQKYWESNPYVYLVTDEGVFRYEIYATYMAEVAGKTYALEIGDQLKASFIRMTLEEADYETGIQPAVTDRIITLSTCIGHADYRRVVHARLAMTEVTVNENSLQEQFLQ